MQEIAHERIGEFTKELIETFEDAHEDVCREIDSTGLLNDENKEVMITFAKKLSEKYVEKKEQ